MSTILSVVDAMNATEGFVRPMREGEEVLSCGLVITVRLRERKDSTLHIQALVMRTSGIKQHPYLVELWVDVEQDYGSRLMKDESLECECPAGQSQKCKHVVAVMLYLARVEDTELEDLSSTDVEQQWGALKATSLKEYEAKRLTDLCHVKEKKEIYVATIPEVTKEMEEKWKNRLSCCAPLSEHSLFFSGVRTGLGVADNAEDASSRALESANILERLLCFQSWAVLGKLHVLTNQKVELLEPDLLTFYQSYVQVSLDQSVAIARACQGTTEWKNERKKRLTASAARSQYTYYVNKKADWDNRYKQLYHSSFRGSEDTLRGIRYESVARETYEDYLSCKVAESGLLVRPELPWLGASLDGTVLSERGDFVRNIEIKTPKEGTRLVASELSEMNAVKTLDMNGNMKKANDHYAQMQIGMLLTGLSECDYVNYSVKGNDFLLTKVQFDPPYTFDLVSRLIHVYFDVFLPKIMEDFCEEE